MLTPRTNRIEAAICLAVLVIAPLVWWYPLANQGTLPWSFDHLYFLAPWEDARPLGLDAPENPDHAEVATRLYPQYQFLSERIANRESFLWNPYEDCGTPFFAQWETRSLSPFSLPIYLLPLDIALALSIILKMMVAGLCAYYAARRLAHGVAASFAVGLAYQLGGVFTLWHAWPVSDALPWFPLLVVYADHLHMDGKRSWPLAAIGFMLVLLGGGPAIGMGVASFLFLYLVMRHVLDNGKPFDLGLKTVRLAGVLAGGATITAVQAFPYLESLWHGYYESAASTPLSWMHLAALAFPHIFGGEAAQMTEAGLPVTPRMIGLVHVGIAPVLSLALWWAVRPFLHTAQCRRMEAMVWVALGFTALALLTGLLPALRFVDPAWLLFANAFVAILLAATAAEEWVVLDPEEVQAALKRFVFALPPLAAVLAAMVLPGFLVERPESVPLSTQLAIAGGLALCAGMFLIWGLFRPSARVMGYGLALIMAVDLGFAFRPIQSWSTPEERYPETPFITALRDQDARVTGSSALSGWPLSVHGLTQVLGAGRYRMDRHDAFMARVADDPMLLRRTGAGNLLLTREDIQGPFARVRQDLRILSVFESGAVLCSDLATPSRARVIHEARPVRAFDPMDLSSEAPPLLESPEPVRPVPGSAARVEEVFEKGPSHTIVEVRETRPGYLVLADSHYPGWRVTLNGEPAAHFPADGLFRAVAVPEEGAVVAEFRFRPISVLVGACISVLALIFVLALALRDGLRRRSQEA